jgi:hypothetical protein
MRVGLYPAFIYTLLGLILCLPCQGQSISTFKLRQAVVHVAIPDNWQSAENLYSAPLTLLGPEQNSIRPVITIFPSGKPAGDMDMVQAGKDESVYRKGRREFIDSVQGELVDFIPIQKENWQADVKGYSVGVRYRVDDSDWVSRSYYISCKSRFFLVKSLIPSQTDYRIEPVAQQILRSFECD